MPHEVAELWAHMCPAQVYEVGTEDDDGTVMVDVAPSNCVQCGAITAKGGRLTPPEGGSGPEYTADLTALTADSSFDRSVSGTTIRPCSPSASSFSQASS